MGVSSNKLVLISILLLSFVFVWSLSSSSNLVNAANGTNNSAFVSIYSDPIGASTFINSVYVGNTPVNATVLEGYATILIKKNGYYDYTNISYLSSSYQNYIYKRLQPLNTGNLYVYTDRLGASIWVDNIFQGNNGYAWVMDLNVGNHIVKTYLNGYQNTTTNVTVNGNQDTVLYLTLTPITPINTTGSLYVTTNPSGANVYVDGAYKGLSPLTIPNVATGTRNVYATKTGYVPSGSYFPYVYANQVTNVSFTLQINQTNTSTGSVWMWSPVPVMSYKYLDGVSQGYGHVFIQNVAPGTHIAKATYPGFDNYTTTINVVAGQMTNVSLPLTRTPVTIYNCTDTDQSYYPTINIYTKGTASTYAYNPGSVGFSTATDSCNGANLVEYYCSNKTIPYMVTNVTCAYGCSDGACLMSNGGGECDDPGSCPVEILPRSRTRSPDRSSNLIAILSFVAAIALFFLLITKKKKAKTSKKATITRSSKKKRI